MFTADGSAKSLLIDEKMTVGHVTRILAEKNHVALDPKWGLVELVPDLYIERVYEDHENLVENCLMWKVDSKNTLWFIERPEKFDIFKRPELYLLGSSSSQKGDLMEEHSRQELLEEYFSSSGIGAPEVEGFIWLKAENKKSWKKFYFVLRSSGLYYAPKGKKTSKDLVCLSTFDVNQVYYGAGWQKKYKSPSPYCFCIKHPQIQAKTPKYIRYLCVDTERELHQWVTGIRVAKNGKQIYENHRSIEEEITHADIDILTSKRFSVNAPNSLPIANGASGSNGNVVAVKLGGGSGITPTSSPARTPSSENKSLDSALSSGIVSDANSPSASSSQFSSIAEDSSSEAAAAANGSDSNTPVNTIDRHQRSIHHHHASIGRGGPRPPSSRSSNSSSSSGCLTDSRASLQDGSQSGGGGFDADFPAGGTIKKRPSGAAGSAAQARIPLTSTTWGMLANSDGAPAAAAGGSDSDSVVDVAGAPNVRVGGGGTLLRSAVRQSLRKQQHQINGIDGNGGGGTLRRSNGSLDSEGGSSSNSSNSRQNSHQVITAEVHRIPQQQQQQQVDPLSAQFESSLQMHQQHPQQQPQPSDPPLPPPPRDESLDCLAMTTSIMSEGGFDDLPPPPPELQQQQQLQQQQCNAANTGGHYHVSPVRNIRPTPAPLPPSLKTGGAPPRIAPGGRRISFDDNVELIPGDGGPVRRQPMPQPQRLYRRGREEETAVSTAAPPPSFLHDLRRVMDKKWQVAEKCRVESGATPHQVLGFRDQDVPRHIVGSENVYSKDDTVGAWVMQQQLQQQQQMAMKEPLYAVARKQVPMQQQAAPSHYSPSHARQQQQQMSYQIQQQQQLQQLQQQQLQHQQQQQQQMQYQIYQQQQMQQHHQHHHHAPPAPPVVLREPSPPEAAPQPQPQSQPQPQYSAVGAVVVGNAQYGHYQRSDANNFTTLAYATGPSAGGAHSPPLPPPPAPGQVAKRPPPPPRRSENTQLTTSQN